MKSKVKTELIPLEKQNKILIGLYFHTVGSTRWGRAGCCRSGTKMQLVTRWDPGCQLGALAGVWDLSSSRWEQRWKQILRDLEALSIGWRVDVFFACFELVTGLWLGDAPASGLPSTLWVSHVLGMGGLLCDHFRYFCFNWPLLAFISAHSKYCAWARLYLTSNSDHFLGSNDWFGFVHFGFEVPLQRWSASSSMKSENDLGRVQWGNKKCWKLNTEHWKTHKIYII